MNLELESERLHLRPFAMADVDIAIEILTDPVAARYIGKTYTNDEVTAQMPTVVRRCAGGAIGLWCVIDRRTKEKLGWALLLPLPIEEGDTNWDLVVGDALPDAEIEIGYAFKQSAWGKGYATEACKRLLRFAFEETPLEEIVAVTAPANTASQHVLRKSGLVDEGMRRAYAKQCPGFRITRRQWSQQRRLDA